MQNINETGKSIVTALCLANPALVDIAYERATEAFSEPCQTSKMELFAKIINFFQPLNIFGKKLRLRYLAVF